MKNIKSTSLTLASLLVNTSVVLASASLAIGVSGCTGFVPTLTQAVSPNGAQQASVTTQASLPAGQVQVVEYYHAGFNHYFMTTHPNEQQALDSGALTGWTRTGYSFNAFADAAPGLNDVCRYYGNVPAGGPNTHFYSANPMECEKLKSDPTFAPYWIFEEIAFHIGLPSGGTTCPSGMTVIKRIYNQGEHGVANHRYVSENNTGEIARMEAQGWLVEGPVFCSPSASTSKIDPSNRASVVDAYKNRYKAPTPAMQWTGNINTCTPGTTSVAFQQRVIDQINFYREMAGLNPVTLIANQGDYQAAALMMSANDQLSHGPPNTWKCYSDAGAEGARSSNLALGADGPYAIDIYMDDFGGNNSSVGHRSWLLKTTQSAFATGDVPGANSLAVFIGGGGNTFNGPFVAWPSPGYFPYQLIPYYSQRWSFSVIGGNYSGAQVTMRNITDGINIPVTIEVPSGFGFGDGNVVWVPQGMNVGRPAHDTVIEVKVANVIVSGVSRSYTYQVILIDPN